MKEKLFFPKFEPCRDNFNSLLENRKKENTKRSKSDLRHGWASPETSPIYQHLKTAESAIVCGLQSGETEVLFEGLDLLQTAIKRVIEQEFPGHYSENQNHI